MKHAIAFGVAALVASTMAWASSAPGLPADLLARGWEEITFDGKVPNRYAACGDGCVEVATDGSVSLVGRPLPADLTETPIVTWEWRVTAPPPASDLTVKGQDDRALAVYVTFPYDPDKASFGENLLRPLIEVFRGRDTPARSIAYVWAGYGAPGEVVRSPYYGDVNVMVVARIADAPVGQWLRETIDVAADHERIFGFRPDKSAHVLIGADSDDRGVANTGRVRGISFHPRR